MKALVKKNEKLAISNEPALDILDKILIIKNKSNFQTYSCPKDGDWIESSYGCFHFAKKAGPLNFFDAQHHCEQKAKWGQNLL